MINYDNIFTNSPLLVFCPYEEKLFLWQRNNKNENIKFPAHKGDHQTVPPFSCNSMNNRLFQFPAHNKTPYMDGNPLQVGSGAPCPTGFISVSPPDFISQAFRKEFYMEHIGEYNILPGESLVQAWGEFAVEEMGRVRFALGSSLAPKGFGDGSAWEREILIHGGKTFSALTRGCIRMDDHDLELLAKEYILYYKKGIHLGILLVLPGVGSE